MEMSLAPMWTVKVRQNLWFIVSDRLRMAKQAMTVSDDKVDENLSLDITGPGY